MGLPNLRDLWHAKEAASEAARVAHREVRDSKHELGQLMDGRAQFSSLPGWEGSPRERIMATEIQRVRDELTYARQDADEADQRLLKAEAAIAAALSPRRG